MLIPGLSTNWVNQHTLKSAIPAPTVAPDTNLNNVREANFIETMGEADAAWFRSHARKFLSEMLKALDSD